MKTRIAFGVCGFAFVLLALYVFPPVVLYLCVSVLCGLACYELIGSTGLVRERAVVTLCTALAVVYAVSEIWLSSAVVSELVSLAILISLFLHLLHKHEKMDFSQLACAYFGTVVLPTLLLSLVRIFDMRGGELLVLLPLVAAWGSDTFAYFTGVLFGRHKLAPLISPKKTVEGSVGGVAGAVILMIGAVALFNHHSAIDLPYWVAAVLGACGAVVGQLGDLAFSIIKRQTGIKDYGRIFPGHGGVLDRFDSVIFVAPVVELLLRLLSANAQ